MCVCANHVVNAPLSMFCPSPLIPLHQVRPVGISGWISSTSTTETSSSFQLIHLIPVRIG